MAKKVTPAQQDEAYNHGYTDYERKAHGGEYDNPYDSDKFWLLFMAYEQGWNDRIDWELSRGAVSAHP